MSIFWRLSHFFYHYRIRTLGKIFNILNNLICSNAISAEMQIGEYSVFMHHGIGCVVHEKTIIGSNCRVFQNVTIGARWPEKGYGDGVPVIGNNVQIGCGAAILGKVTIGNNSIIGANAVVVKDVPDNCIAVGVPAQIIPRKTNMR